MRSRVPVSVVLTLLPVLVQLPVLTPWFSADPILWVSDLAVKLPTHDGLLPGLPGWIDGNAGVTTEALGHLAAEDWLHGRLPWWNPYSGIGLPLAAEMQNSALFLPFVLLLHFARGVLLLKIAMQVLTGFATLALLRALRIRASVAALVAVLAEFQGSFAWVSHAPIMPIPFLPLLLLGIERCRLAALDRQRGPSWLVAVAVALSITAGFPETAFLDGLLAAVFALARLATLPVPARAGCLIRLGEGLVGGLLLSAPATTVFLQFLQHGYLSINADGAASHLRAGNGAMALLPYVFGPIMFGNVTTGTGEDLWWHQGAYLGLPLFLLTLISLSGPDRRERLLRLLLAAWTLLGVAKAAGCAPAVFLFGLIPFVDHTIFDLYAWPGWEMCALLLAAFALDDRRPNQSAPRAAVAASLGATLACLAAALWLARHEIVRLTRHAPHYALIAGPPSLLLLTAAVAVAALLAAHHTRRRSQAMAAILLSTTIGDFAVPLLSAVPDRPLDQSAVAFLRQHLGLQRFYSIWNFEPNYGAYESLAQVNHNYLPVPQDWVDYLHTHVDPTLEGVTFFRHAPHTNGAGLGEVADPAETDADSGAVAAALARLAVAYAVVPHGFDPTVDTVATPAGMSGGSALALAPGVSTTVPLPTPARLEGCTVDALAIEIATYHQHASGTVGLELCSPAGCAHAVTSVDDVPDNGMLRVTLTPPFTVPSGEPLSVRLTRQTGAGPVAVWLRPAPAGGLEPYAVLRFRPASSPLHRVYADPLIDIFAISNPAPYMSDEAAACRLVVADRRHAAADCSRPGRLVRRELFWPGWRVSLNGRPATLVRTQALLQSVALPPGRSSVEFRYVPPGIAAAWWAALAALVWLACRSGADLLWTRGHRNVWRSARGHQSECQ